jgi:uroporphyrinogen decarboxylase
MIRFEPFPYDHAASLISRRPWEVSRRPELLFQAFKTTIERYRLSHVVLGIDIYNLEAETLGCKVAEPDGNGSPLISQPICSSHADILQLRLEFDSASRFPWLLDTAQRLQRKYPACAFKIPITGPFTLAGHLLGLDNLLCDCLLKPAETRATLEYLASLLLEFIRRAVQKDFEVTLFESSASPPMLSPGLFRTLLKPVLQDLFNAVERLKGMRPALIMGGNTLPVLQQIMDLHPSYIICPIETDQPRFVSRMVESSAEIHLRVNMHPEVFTQDSAEATLLEASRALQLASLCKRSSIGTILPFTAIPAMVDAVSEFTTRE